MPVTAEVKTILELLAAIEGPPLEEVTPDELRANYAAMSMAATKADLASVEDRMVPGPGGDIPVRVYVPEGSSDGGAPSPVLVYFHGGGWVIGNIETHDPTARALAARSGFTVVSVDYRLAPSTRSPPRWTTAWPRWSGSWRRRRSWGSTRPGWLSAATRPAATWPRWWRPGCGTRGCALLPAVGVSGHGRDAEPPVDRRERRRLFPDQGDDGLVLAALRRLGLAHRPVGLAAARPRRRWRACARPWSSRPSSIRCGTRARRMRRTCRRPGSGHHDQVRRRDPRLLPDGGHDPRGQPGPRPGGGCIEAGSRLTVLHDDGGR